MRQLLLLFLWVASAGRAATIEWLPGRTAEEPAAYATSVSDDGRVVLGRSGNVPVVWRDGTPTELRAPAGYRTIEVASLSPDGTFVAGFGMPFGPLETSGTIQSPIVWGADGEPSIVGVGGRFFSYASDISAGGKVVVGLYPAAPGYFGPARWTEETGWQAITPKGGGDYVGVSADGNVAVGTYVEEGVTQAFRWTVENGLQPLGYLPGGNNFSRPEAVSPSGAFVTGYSNGSRGNEPFIWSEEKGMRAIFAGDDSVDVERLIPTGVSDTGVVIGFDLHDFYADMNANDLRAFMWDEARGLRYLDDIAAVDSNASPPGAVLSAAYGISANGLTIVGSGNGPNSGAWVLRLAIPEPQSVVLFVVSGIAVGFFHRRSGRS